MIKGIIVVKGAFPFWHFTDECQRFFHSNERCDHIMLIELTSKLFSIKFCPEKRRLDVMHERQKRNLVCSPSFHHPLALHFFEHQLMNINGVFFVHKIIIILLCSNQAGHMKVPGWSVSSIDGVSQEIMTYVNLECSVKLSWKTFHSKNLATQSSSSRELCNRHANNPNWAFFSILITFQTLVYSTVLSFLTLPSFPWRVFLCYTSTARCEHKLFLYLISIVKRSLKIVHLA